MAKAKKAKSAPKPAKAVNTVREQAAKQQDKARQPRRLKQTASLAASPFKALASVIGSILRPLKFLLAPFKTRPMRFVGRILSKILLLNYFKGSWHELRQVIWPKRKETTKLTFAVIMFAIVFGITISIVDFGLDKLFRKVLLQ